jgi:hypothetical protein
MPIINKEVLVDNPSFEKMRIQITRFESLISVFESSILPLREIPQQPTPEAQPEVGFPRDRGKFELQRSHFL